MSIENLFRENIKNLAPYSTARDEYQGDIGIYLDANENPYDNGYNRYPDPYQKKLKGLLSEIKGIDSRHIFIGNGSDEPIDLVYRVFCEPGVHNAVSIAPSYGMYKVSANINNVEFREVQLGENFELDADKLLAATDSNTRVIFLCSPNNPSGNLLDLAHVERVITNFNGIVVVDEAYIDFAECDSLIRRLAEFPNLIVLQTLSKAWGMAGLRLGLAFAGELIIETLTKVKYPYNINVVTQELVYRQIENNDVKRQIAELCSEREKVMNALSSSKSVKRLFASDANFVLIRVDRPRELYEKLIAYGVIVRDRSRIKGCDGCLRITIGTPAENDRMIEIIKNYE